MEAMDGGGVDRISLLPDYILGEIVTRLPTTDAVRVQVLSTRWRLIWRCAPLNLDLHYRSYHDYDRLLSGILAAHPGPSRRLKVDCSSPGDDDCCEAYDRWLQSPALNGLQELEIEARYGYSPGRREVDIDARYSYSPDLYSTMRALPERAFHFAPTLRVLRVSNHAFPTAAAVAALRFPHLDLISFRGVDISEGALHGLIAGCPVLKTLVLDQCTGFATVQINSPTMTSFAFSPANSSTDDYQYGMPIVMRTWQVTIEEAPLLEKLVPCRRSAEVESFRLRVVSAPRLRVLGSLSFTISKLEIGSGTVFELTPHRVNRVRDEGVIMEERLVMGAVMLATTLRTVKILALEEVESIDTVSNYLRCFPCVEKLYISASQGFRSAASYDKHNPIECLEHHLKMVALDGYDGKRSHVKFAQFFVRNARFLELLKFRTYRDYYHEPEAKEARNALQISGGKEWTADQLRQLQITNMASQHVKFHFVRDARYYMDVYCGEDIEDLSELIYDASRDDPFHQWFESEKEPLPC